MELLNKLIQKIERKHIIHCNRCYCCRFVFIYIVGALGPTEPKLVLVGSIPDNEYDLLNGVNISTAIRIVANN